MSTAGTTTTNKIGTATVTKKAFAELMRVHTSTVSQWIRRRKLTPPALRPNGTVHVERARAQLSQTVGYGRMASPVSAAARSSTAEDATSVRLNRARSRVLEIAVESREFDLAIAAGVVISVEDARRATGRDLSDALGAVVSWVESVAGVVLGAPDDCAATAALRLCSPRCGPGCAVIATSRRRALRRWGSPRLPSAATLREIPHPPKITPMISELRQMPHPTYPARKRRAPGGRRRKASGSADCVANGRKQRPRTHLPGVGRARPSMSPPRSGRPTVAAGFRAIRAQLERQLRSLAAAVRAAGDVRRGTIAARTWLRDVRMVVSRQGEGTTTK
jgi:hypothetical protein